MGLTRLTHELLAEARSFMTRSWQVRKSCKRMHSDVPCSPKLKTQNPTDHVKIILRTIKEEPEAEAGRSISE